jgi:hypothetical protein
MDIVNLTNTTINDTLMTANGSVPDLVHQLISKSIEITGSPQFGPTLAIIGLVVIVLVLVEFG